MGGPKGVVKGSFPFLGWTPPSGLDTPTWATSQAVSNPPAQSLHGFRQTLFLLWDRETDDVSSFLSVPRP